MSPNPYPNSLHVEKEKKEEMKELKKKKGKKKGGGTYRYTNGSIH